MVRRSQQFRSRNWEPAYTGSYHVETEKHEIILAEGAPTENPTSDLYRQTSI